ncbi:hypothetical protein AGRA3207_006501 [Actinomadura graeca]|uniref:Uncharacterized protein n=1 Tax=Actinomadura graeca TaxID=2750812 RepID=A0ABX8R7T3_9ACTN|nr:hypothetical protein AGRA3207_006501 [Actinomadura graeca]
MHAVSPIHAVSPTYAAPSALTLSPHLAGAPDLAAASGTVVVRRDGPARSLTFIARQGGEAVVGFEAAAPGISWDRKGAESAVVSIAVDGRHVTDLVVPSSEPTPRSLGLGHVRPGRHKVTLRFARGSAPAARRVLLTRPRIGVPRADQVALRHAPVIIGRTTGPLNDPYQNATTDTPLIAWHETRPAETPGHQVIEYSVVWSNEDGGTDSPALMARWGRTTDIEWIYRVEVDASGRRVDGTGVYQAPEHATLKFTGRYEADHPLLQTCTQNNNMCDAVSKDAPLRFLPDVRAERPAGRAREVVMDREPWTYRVMAQEMVREEKIEEPSDPSTREVGDQRAYLFAEFAKTTGSPAGTGSVPGVALGVRLKSDPSRLYRSDHDQPTWSIERDGAVATTVEVPEGTALSDIVSVEAIRRPVGAGDNGASATVTAVNRGFFLDGSYLPLPSGISWTGSVALSKERPSAVLWRP